MALAGPRRLNAPAAAQGSAPAPRETAPQPVAAAAVDAPKPTGAEPTDRFAARMSYELSHTPEEPPAKAAAAIPAPVAAPAEAEPATAKSVSTSGHFSR